MDWAIDPEIQFSPLITLILVRFWFEIWDFDTFWKMKIRVQGMSEVFCRKIWLWLFETEDGRDLKNSQQLLIFSPLTCWVSLHFRSIRALRKWGECAQRQSRGPLRLSLRSTFRSWLRTSRPTRRSSVKLQLFPPPGCETKLLASQQNWWNVLNRGASGLQRSVV